MKNSSDSGKSSSAPNDPVFDTLIDTMSGDACPLCSNSINKDDPTNWKQVVGFVGGPKKDSMRLRQDTGILAHDACVKKLAEGQAPDQPSMFEDQYYLTKNSGVVPMKEVGLPEELQ